MKRLGRYLKKLRLEKGFTLPEIQKMAKISTGYLSEIEQGKRTSPHPDILNKLARIYEVQVGELMRIAGYLPEEENRSVFSPEDEAEWAFHIVLSDPEFGPFLDKSRVRFMSIEMKKKLIKTYETMTGRKLLK